MVILKEATGKYIYSRYQFKMHILSQAQSLAQLELEIWQRRYKVKIEQDNI